LYLLHATLERAYRASDRTNDANEKLKWLQQNQGRAYAEYNQDYFMQPVNVYTHFQARLAIKKQGL
jgi:hypothetical protein